MTRLVAVAVATLALAVVCLAGGSSSAAAGYAHYFAIGKRACRPVPTETHDGGTAIVLRAVNPLRYPAQYRRAVAAGCRAALSR